MSLEDYGITSVSTALVSKLTRRKKVEPGTPVLTSEGAFHTNVAKNPIFEIEAEGFGDLPGDFALGSGGPTVVGISGGITIIEEAEESQAALGDPNKWTAKAVNAPSAT